MSDAAQLPHDEGARERFRCEFERNFAVSASAGSGKTTAISERLARLALAPAGAELLPKTVVVTFTKKAAAQIRQRARAVLWRELAKREGGAAPARAQDLLDRAFFGTIHSFCLVLAQRHGQALGLHLNPTVIEGESDDELWEEFLEHDAMEFSALPPGPVEAFLRHAPLDVIFPLARELQHATARRWLGRERLPAPPGPGEGALGEILAAKAERGGEKARAALAHNQRVAAEWARRWREERGYLPFAEPKGTAAGIGEKFRKLYAPLKAWLAEAGAVLAAELAERYRAWRFERGVQTYADQIEAALAVLRNPATLEAIRAEGYRVLLDEAQDTDPQQFAVLVEIARPPGAAPGMWPRDAAIPLSAGAGAPPRPGHFCMVGDAQQSIYGSRADLRNFRRHLEAFARGDGGEALTFEVTFRAPKRAIELFNEGFPKAFGAEQEYNLGLEPRRVLQVPYVPLVAGPGNEEGAVSRLPLAAPSEEPVEARLTDEVRQVARFLREHGPAGVGARHWGEVCLLAPRNEWLVVAQRVLREEGLRPALQMRKNRNGDQPPYAWLCGLLAVVADPENRFEWVGVLREIFAVPDAELAAQLHGGGGLAWDEPERYGGPLGGALGVLKPCIEQADAEGVELGAWTDELVRAAALRERLRLIDTGGVLEAELDRLLAQAAELGRAGAGPREFLRELLLRLDEGRPAGKPAEDAINLLTSHSAKGLEWPVVIPLGLWRGLIRRDETGLRLVSGAGGARVFFDRDSLPEETKLSREREWLREQARLLYVAFTRARRHLVLPWNPAWVGRRGVSFAQLWGATELWDRLPEIAGTEFRIAERETTEGQASVGKEDAPPPAGLAQFGVQHPASLVAERLLPHQLAAHGDAARGARHESAQELPAPAGRDDPIDYGLWWHETMELLPWQGSVQEVEAHGVAALAAAEKLGFGPRAREEWRLWRDSALWRELRRERWRLRAELSVLAPLGEKAWVDGVIDLVAHDAAAGELLVIDWKTNRRRPGEDIRAWLARLVEEYRAQLGAYGGCLAQFFPGCRVRLGLYASGAGEWREA